MNNNNVYSLNSTDFLAAAFARRMQAEGRPVDIGGNQQYGRGTSRLVLPKRYALLPAGDSTRKG